MAFPPGNRKPRRPADINLKLAGKYNFGFVDEHAFNGPLLSTPVDSTTGYWTFTSPSFFLNSTAASDTPVTGIADTGTTMLLLPGDLVKSFYATVPGAMYDQNQAGWVLPCKDAPDVQFEFGDGNVTIPGSYISFAPITPDQITCYGGIQDQRDIGTSIFGSVALKAGFIVFQPDPPTLSWAEKPLN